MELRITASIPCSTDAIEQARLLTSMQKDLDALRAAVVAAGGTLDTRYVRPTGPRPKKAEPANA